ncbi:MAG: hypothetical protein ABSF44_10295 [Candidatus Bathyarchaeia archaeon]
MIEEVIKELIKHTGCTVAHCRTILSESPSLESEHAFVTLQCRDGRRKFFVKMARTCHDSGRILRETEILLKLRDIKVENIPEVVLFGDCEGRAYLIENFIENSVTGHSSLTSGNTLSNILAFLGSFYSQTKSGTIEPQELIHRAERIANFAHGFIDLTDALYVLDKSKPKAKIPAVCRHGDIADVNFILTSHGLVAIDFGFAKFDEPPSEPYVLVSPAKLKEHARYLDVLSLFDDVDPLFFAMYENIIHLGEELAMLRELEEDLIVINKIGYFAPQAQIGNIEELKLYYQEKSCQTKA